MYYMYIFLRADSSASREASMGLITTEVIGDRSPFCQGVSSLLITSDQIVCHNPMLKIALSRPHVFQEFVGVHQPLLSASLMNLM